MITSPSEASPDDVLVNSRGDNGGAGRDRPARTAIDDTSALTDRARIGAALEAHDRNWGPLEARAAAAGRGEVTLTRGELIMLARRADEKLQKKRGRPKGGSWKTVDHRVELSRRLANLQWQGLKREDAIAAVMEEFNAGRKAVEAAEPLFKSYARSEHWIQDIDLDALRRGECPPIGSKRPRHKQETEADHLAALARVLRRSGH